MFRFVHVEANAGLSVPYSCNLVAWKPLQWKTWVLPFSWLAGVSRRSWHSSGFCQWFQWRLQTENSGLISQLVRVKSLFCVLQWKEITQTHMVPQTSCRSTASKTFLCVYFFLNQNTHACLTLQAYIYCRFWSWSMPFSWQCSDIKTCLRESLWALLRLGSPPVAFLWGSCVLCTLKISWWFGYLDWGLFSREPDTLIAIYKYYITLTFSIICILAILEVCKMER